MSLLSLSCRFIWKQCLLNGVHDFPSRLRGRHSVVVGESRLYIRIRVVFFPLSSFTCLGHTRHITQYIPRAEHGSEPPHTVPHITNDEPQCSEHRFLGMCPVPHGMSYMELVRTLSTICYYVPLQSIVTMGIICENRRGYAEPSGHHPQGRTYNRVIGFLTWISDEYDKRTYCCFVQLSETVEPRT